MSERWTPKQLIALARLRYRGRLHGFEIKTVKGKLTAAQGAFPVVRSVEEALTAIGCMKS